MANINVVRDLRITSREAERGTRRIVVRKGKRLEVTIPAGVKDGTLVKLSGALQLTDGYYGDFYIQIHIDNTRRNIFAVSAVAVVVAVIIWIAIAGAPPDIPPDDSTSPNHVAVGVPTTPVVPADDNSSSDGLSANSTSPVFSGYITTFNNKQPDDFPNNGKPVHLANNDSAVNPSWKELKAFLYLDKTDQKSYIEGYFECASFAEEVHNNAEARGIKAAFVGIFFTSEFEGHALNAFQTTDKGLIYIDCQGFDCVAYIEEQKQYGLILLDMAEAFSYNYFIHYKDEFKFTPSGIVDLVFIYW